MTTAEAWKIVIFSSGWFWLFILLIACIPLTVIARAKVNTKANRRAWHAFVPFLSRHTRAAIGGKTKTFWHMWICYFLIFVFIFFADEDLFDLMDFWLILAKASMVLFALNYIIIEARVALSFGYEMWFTTGLVLLPFVFYPILAWNKKEYIGPQTVDMFDRQTGQRLSCNNIAQEENLL